MRKVSITTGEYYHIFNRGVDKREIFSDQSDFRRFFQGMEEFNAMNPIGSIYENSFRKKDSLGNGVSKSENKEKLIGFVCYCLNPNHYHFILEQLADKGVEKFMHRLGVGYTKYFNQKYKRSGFLFQGPFKCKHVVSNEYLLHLSAYVNLNFKVHQLGNGVSKSSWGEYISDRENNEKNFCNKNIVLEQFKNFSEYENFALDSLKDIQERKDIENILLE